MPGEDRIGLGDEAAIGRRGVVLNEILTFKAAMDSRALDKPATTTMRHQRCQAFRIRRKIDARQGVPFRRWLADCSNLRGVYPASYCRPE